MDNKGQNFLEPKTMVAVALAIVFLIGWQSYLSKKYPKPEIKSVAQVPAPAAEAPKEETTDSLKDKKSANDSVTSAERLALPETKLEQETGQFRVQISSLGMGFSEITVKGYKDRTGGPVRLGYQLPYSFQTSAKGVPGPLHFSMERANDYQIVGRAAVGSSEIIKTYTFEPSSPVFKVSIKVTGAKGLAGIEHSMADVALESEQSLFAPSAERQEYYVSHGTEEDRGINSKSSPFSGSFSQVSVVGIGTQYFGMAMMDDSSIMPEVTLGPGAAGAAATVQLTHANIAAADEVAIEMKGFLGAKNANLLKSLDPRLAKLVDFGFFSWIAYPLLGIMKALYGFFGNYGVAIILLTILVRIVVLPFNIASYKSMKVMQTIQPQINALREKYKNDPQAMNKEMMHLMKVNKANPLGGCLPVFLQIPIFFALYRVFAESIELYQAPFAFWIIDLSIKDPFYVLPIAMGISMFVQQKITPTTMDPSQAKIMLFMPIMFSFFMLGLPSGLTLYMFVSTIFGIAQQKLFLRDRKPQVKAAQAMV